MYTKLILSVDFYDVIDASTEIDFSFYMRDLVQTLGRILYFIDLL